MRRPPGRATAARAGCGFPQARTASRRLRESPLLVLRQCPRAIAAWHTRTSALPSRRDRRRRARATGRDMNPQRAPPPLRCAFQASSPAVRWPFATAPRAPRRGLPRTQAPSRPRRALPAARSTARPAQARGTPPCCACSRVPPSLRSRTPARARRGARRAPSVGGPCLRCGTSRQPSGRRGKDQDCGRRRPRTDAETRQGARTGMPRGLSRPARSRCARAGTAPGTPPRIQAAGARNRRRAM